MKQFLGIDFGTTNSAAAVCDEKGAVRLATYYLQGKPVQTFRSVIYFGPPSAMSATQRVRVGPEAIEAYLEEEGEGRLIMSVKSYLGSADFTSTQVGGRQYTIEGLSALILRGIRRGVERTLGDTAEAIVVGRPVVFANSTDSKGDEIALSRFRTALGIAGNSSVEFLYEPVAAAYYYESTLDHDEVVLTADFGGGTSDFCLAQMGPSVRRRGRSSSDIIGTGGIGVAGDAFDADLIDKIVAPALGKDSHHRSSLGKLLPVPKWIYSNLMRWHLLSFLKTKDTLDFLGRLETRSTEPEKIRALIHIVSNNLGFRLYQSIEETKVQLSRGDLGAFSLVDDQISIRREVTRTRFEGWIGESVNRIVETLNSFLSRVGVSGKEIDRVFMTGGSSFVPLLRRKFEERFGREKISSGAEMTSVAVGLAMHARELG